jgi:hypothetical protein
MPIPANIENLNVTGALVAGGFGDDALQLTRVSTSSAAATTTATARAPRRTGTTASLHPPISHISDIIPFG